jgi:NitT/TauT family transport system ATP-binding protein/sulfonate transport system ATP-binding protein
MSDSPRHDIGNQGAHDSSDDSRLIAKPTTRFDAPEIAAAPVHAGPGGPAHAPPDHMHADPAHAAEMLSETFNPAADTLLSDASRIISDYATSLPATAYALDPTDDSRLLAKPVTHIAEPSVHAKPILNISHVGKKFQIGTQTVEALRDANLAIEKGEFVCLIGASGCGKSTLLRIIAGFETASSGTASIYGTPIKGPGPERGMVFQDYALFPWLTVRENIGFGPKQRGLMGAGLKDVAARYMDMVGLTKFADYYPAQLSGGMKQRVAIARVLANNCEVLLMDEPFGALDALTREKLQLDLLKIWKETKMTVIFVTHSVEEAVFLSTRVVVMTAGPGRIEHDEMIDLPRPRDVSAPDFNIIRREITQRLTSHVAPVGETV